MTIADKFQAIAENEQKVYDKGYSDGAAQGGGGSYDQGFEDGKQAQLDQFWNDKTNNFAKTDYKYAFYSSNYTNLFPPPKVIKPKDATNMFYSCRAESTENFDFSLCTNFSYAFGAAEIKNIGMVDFSSATATTAPFYACKAESISIRGISHITSLSSWFGYCNVKEFRIEGDIPVSCSFSNATSLSHDSIVNIVNALSATASGQTLTLSKTAVNNAFGSKDSAEWQALIAPKTQWSFSLV